MITLKNLLNDQIRGATAIFNDSITLFLSENDLSTIKYGVEKLKESFPVMGLFVNLWTKINTKNTVKEIHNILNDFNQHLKSSINQVIENAGNQLPNECRIITISHSSYVRELIINNKEKIKTVYCLESEPELEGIVLANLLNEKGIDAQIVPDINYQSQLTKSTHVIVGTDLISEHYFINKSGSKVLINLAFTLGKNIWILGDELRFVSGYIPENISGAFEMITMRDEFRIFSILRGQ